LLLGFFKLASAQDEKISYGFNTAINYSTIGSSYENYVGVGNPSLSLFISYKPSNGINLGHPTKNEYYTLRSDEFMRRLTFVLQPAYCANSFRQQDIDRKYNNYYLELGGLVYFQPFTYVTELTFFTGICPSFLASYNTEQLQFGYYSTIHYDQNLNTVGKIDFVMPFGVSLEMSQAVSLELSYKHSFTNSNTDQIIQGRTSTVELALRVNAIGLANQFTKKDEQIQEQIKKLSKGSLLVMLPTINNSEINKLKAENKQEEINDINKELIDRNKKVMKEFRSYFNFCPVYFFMDTDAYQIIHKRFNNVFVNANLEVDPMIKTDSSNFFVASFCEDISVYTTKNVYGLFVYDDNINQLPKPFNVAINLIGPNLDGDPLNFLKKIRYEYSTVSFERIITKFNNRLIRFKD
jgi:hypothetical protein